MAYRLYEDIDNAAEGAGMYRSISLYISLLFLFAISIDSAEAQTPASSIQWANRLLAHSLFDYQLSKGRGAQRELRDAEQAFNDILAKYGKQNGEAWLGLARAQSLLGEYDKAVASHRQAISLLPDNVVLKKELVGVQNQQIAARTASAMLSNGEEVLQALPYSAQPGHAMWAVLSADVKWNKAAGYYWPDVTNVHLNIFEGTPNTLELIWRSKILGYLGHTQGEFNDVFLYIKDVTNDSVPDLIIPEIFYGASWVPSHIDIFSWRNEKVVHLLGAVTDETLLMKDLSSDNRYEVITDHAVGWDLSHAEQPRWLSIYAYRNGTYRPAEKSFPAEYKALYYELRAALRNHPDDFELLYYLGRVYEIQSRPLAAIRAYKRAEIGAQIAIKQCRAGHGYDLAQRASNICKDIRYRIRELTRRG